MSNLRDFFHTIANWHNKITIAAGCMRQILADKPLNTLAPAELKTLHDKLLAVLDKIETDAVTANEKVLELKKAVYKKINPEEDLQPPGSP